MTALYTSGTYTSPINLLEHIDAFIVSTLGWTRNMGPSAQSGKQGRRAHYQKAITKNGVTRTVYWNLWATGAAEQQGESSSEAGYGQISGALFSYPSTGYNAGLTWDRQPGYPINQASLGVFPYADVQLAPSTPPNFNIFGNSFGDVYVTIQKTAGINSNGFVAAGVLDKTSAGSYAGGEFAGAVGTWVSSNGDWLHEIPTWQLTTSGYRNTSMFVRAPIDGSDVWVGIRDNETATEYDMPVYGRCNYLIALVSTYFRPVPAVTPYCPSLSTVSGTLVTRKFSYCAKVASSSKFAYLGDVPIISYCNAVYSGELPYGTVLDNKFLQYQSAFEMNNV